MAHGGLDGAQVSAPGERALQAGTTSERGRDAQRRDWERRTRARRQYRRRASPSLTLRGPRSASPCSPTRRRRRGGTWGRRDDVGLRDGAEESREEPRGSSSAHSSRSRLGLDEQPGRNQEEQVPAGRLDVNSPVLPRDLRLHTLHRPDRSLGNTVPLQPPPIAPPVGPPPGVAPDGARIDPAPTVKDNSQVFVCELGFGGAPPLVFPTRDSLPAEGTPKAPPPPPPPGARVSGLVTGTLGAAAAQAAALLNTVVRDGLQAKPPGAPPQCRRVI